MPWARMDALGPIFRRELLVLARRRRYYFLRALYAAALLVVVVISHQDVKEMVTRRSVSAMSANSALGQDLFSRLTLAPLVAVVLLAPSYIGSSIALEREQRTIEELFASDFTDFEIVVGKWAARCLNMLLLIIAGIPVLAAATFLGGVSFDRIVLSFAVILTTLASSGALAIAAAIHALNVRRAMILAYSWLLVWQVLPFFVSYIVHINISGERWPQQCFIRGDIFLAVSPFAACDSLVHHGLSNPHIAFNMAIWNCFAQTLAAVALLGWAIARVRVVHQMARLQPPPSEDRIELLLFEREAVEVTDAPVHWKEWHFRPRPRWQVPGVKQLLVVILMIHAAAVFVIPRHGETRTNHPIHFATMAAGCLIYAWIAVRAAASISLERDRETWISILAAPLSGSEILWGKAIGAMRPIKSLLLYYGPIWLLGGVLGQLSPLAYPAIAAIVAAQMLFVAAVGVRQSLVKRTTSSAILSTLGICTAVGFVSGPLFLMLLYIASATRAESAGATFAGAIFFFPLGMSAITYGDNSLMALAIVIVIALGYAATGMLLMENSIANFDRLSGRTIDGRRRQTLSSPARNDKPPHAIPEVPADAAP